LPVALWEVGAARCVFKPIALSEVSKFLGSVLGAIVAPERLRYAVTSKNGFQTRDDRVGHSGLELNNFGVSRNSLRLANTASPFARTDLLPPLAIGIVGMALAPASDELLVHIHGSFRRTA
jgi:hypothetical protein